jgi:Flp pilus assembly protein TadG
MKQRAPLLRDESGATVIETAFVLPALIILLWMVIQLGLVMRAMSGIQHALGEGAREAVMYPYEPPSTSNTKIVDAMNAAVYGIGPGTFNVVPPSEGTADGSTYLDLRVTYTQDTNLIFLPGPTINVTRSKRVWVADDD